ncbi:hypothetical protein FKM82_028322 [Ascaphus truei]
MDDPATEGELEQNPRPDSENPERILLNLIVPTPSRIDLWTIIRVCRGTSGGNLGSRRKRGYHQPSPRNSPLDRTPPKIQRKRLFALTYCTTHCLCVTLGAVSLAGTDSGLWAVEGGNKLVCSGLLYASKAQLIQGTVTFVQEKTRPLRTGGTVKLFEVSYETATGPRLDLYDILIIATPLNKGISNITFLGFSPPIETFSKSYHQTVATFVHGRINASFFGCSEPCHFELSEIITTDNPKLFISSVGAVSPVKAAAKPSATNPAGLKVWKVFSPEPLREDQLRLLFESYDTVSVKTWLAYPSYNPPEKLPPVILHDRIYYINGIEWAASAMEMSAISAKNVALLSYHHWYGKDGHIDQEDLTERLKSEL